MTFESVRYRLYDTYLHCKNLIVNVTTLEVNITTTDRHYSVVKVNCSDVHYHIVVKVNTYFNIPFLHS